MNAKAIIAIAAATLTLQVLRSPKVPTAIPASNNLLDPT